MMATDVSSRPHFFFFHFFFWVGLGFGQSDHCGYSNKRQTGGKECPEFGGTMVVRASSQTPKVAGNGPGDLSKIKAPGLVSSPPPPKKENLMTSHFGTLCVFFFFFFFFCCTLEWAGPDKVYLITHFPSVIEKSLTFKNNS